MKNIEIIESGIYLPLNKIENSELEKELSLDNGYIEKRTGIKTRHYAEEEVEELAKKAVENLFSNISNKEKTIEKIGIIIVATTTPNNIMPGIANEIQEMLNIKKCIALDISAGCSGYINALDIAKMYIETEKVEYALVVGADKLTSYTDKKDISTSIILADGAGAILFGATKEKKKYTSNIEAKVDKNKILTCKTSQKIQMKGREVYKYAVTEPVRNIEQLLKTAEVTLNEIKYIIPHQSNMKIIQSIQNKLKINNEKMYTNIEYVGNTFCASIPIALNEMFEKNLLNEGDKIILIGYGGGLNTGSILIEK